MASFMLPAARGAPLCLLLCLLLAGTFAPATRAAPPVPPAPIVLYDGAAGTLPQAQGWVYLALNGLPAQHTDAGAALLDTSGALAIKAGYFASRQGFLGSTTPVPALDRTAGFTITFTLQVLAENHSRNPNRAGFSVIALGSDKRGVELGFWRDQVWAQEGGTAKLFTRAEGVHYDTSAALARYQLALKGEGYQLFSGGRLLLSGPARDYTAFASQPDPYETPDFLFLGDNTSSASVRFRLGFVAAELPASAPGPPPGAPSHPLFVPLARG